MHEDKKNLLVGAMKSGEHKKGVGCLRSATDDMCCLGVACELYRKVTGKGEWILNATKESFAFVDETGESSESQLTPAVREWFGMKSNHGKHGNAGLSNLIYINDQYKNWDPVLIAIDQHWQEM